MAAPTDTGGARCDAAHLSPSDEAAPTDRAIARLRYALCHHRRALSALTTAPGPPLPEEVRRTLISKLRRDARRLQADLQQRTAA